MSPPGPIAAFLAGSLGLGLLAAGSLGLFLEMTGSAPSNLSSGAVVLVLAASLAHALGERQRKLSALRAPLLVAGLALAWGHDLVLTIAAGGAARLNTSLDPIVMAGALVISLSLLPLSLLMPLASGRRRASWGIAAGLALGAVSGPVVALGLGSMAALWLRDFRSRQGARAPLRMQLDGAWGISLAVLATLSAWICLRGSLDPSPLGAWVALITSVVGFGVGRGLPRLPASLALPAALLLTTGTLALGAEGPALTRSWALLFVQDQGPLPFRFALDLPLALAVLPGSVLVGMGWGRSARPLALLAVGLGFGLGHLGGDLEHLLWCAAGFVALSLFTAPRLGRQLAVGLAAASVLAMLWRTGLPPEDPLASGNFRLLRAKGDLAEEAKISNELRTAHSSAAIDGTTRLRTSERAWRSRDEPESGWPLTAELEGLPRQSRGRLARAEVFAGILAARLDHDRDRVLILGDDLGLLHEGIASRPHGLMRIASAQPSLTRAVAELAPERETRWLGPTVRLLPWHPEAALSAEARDSLDLILEARQAPWADANRAGADAGHFARVRRRLRDDGRYIVVVHLQWWEGRSAAAWLAQLEDHFAHVQVWLPPDGVESVIVVAGAQAPSLAGFLEEEPTSLALLRDLGLPSALDAAGLAVADANGLRSWAGLAPGPHTRLLSDAVAARQPPSLASLAPYFSSTEDLWQSTEVSPAQLEALEGRRGMGATFLDGVQSAAEGDLDELMSRVRQLEAFDDQHGRNTLAPMVEPHTRSAREALARAKREGPSSSGWTEAVNAATTARMLAQRDPDPLLILAEIDLARQDWESAGRRFEQALLLDPDSLEALHGLARSARGRRDMVRAEDAFRRAVQRHPRSWLAWQRMGAFLQELDRVQEAEEALRKAAALAEPSRPQPHLALAELYLAQDQAARALVESERAVRLGGGAYAMVLRGRAHLDLGEHGRADKDFRDAVLADSDLVPARFGVGLARIALGDEQGAAEAFEAVLRIEPDNAAARENLRRLRGIEDEGADGAPTPE